MRNRHYFTGLVCIAIFMVVVGPVAALVIVAPPVMPPNYPVLTPDTTSQQTLPVYAQLANTYVQCLVGLQGNFKSDCFYDDATDGRGDKVYDMNHGSHQWNVSGRWGITTVAGDPDVPESANRPITFCGNAPCHYFGYWKLKIGKDMRMIGDSTGSWYSAGPGMPLMTPTTYAAPPPDLAIKEPYLGRTGPFIRGIWTTKGGNGSEIRTEIRIHLVRDMVKFECRLTNQGNVTEKVGFEQVGDVETGNPIRRATDDGGYYGPYDNNCFAFVPGVGASKPITTQSAMMFGGSAVISGKLVPRPPVPAWIDYYDDMTTPINTARNVLNQEDAVVPDFVAVGEYNDLYHKDLWIPTDYKPDVLHGVLDMCWVLCWDQKDLRPGATRTIITYYGVGAATSRWTYTTGKTVVPDSAVAAVEAPRSLKYNSVTALPGDPEISPSQFSVKAWVYNLATDPGPFDLTDTTATISLPPGLKLVDPSLVPGNTERKEIGLVTGNSESAPVEWQVQATGDYAGELPIYVSIVDNSTAAGSNHWQQTVVRKIYVPAVKRGVFQVGWQLMSVPFNFNDFRIQKVFNLVGAYGAKYWDPKRGGYVQVDQVKPGQGFWINVGIVNYGFTQPFSLPTTAAIVGEAVGTGAQTVSQSIPLSKGWNMIGNPFVYPMYWGQVLVYSATSGGQTVTLDAALRNRWLSTTLFSYNPDKAAYDITSSKEALLDPWKGYWVYAYQPIILILRVPAFPSGDVTANPGGQ